MSARSTRELIAQAAIVLAVCVGAWMMLVKPKIDEVARLEQEIATMSANPAQAVNQQTVEGAARKVSAVKERVRHIHDFNALANDSSRFYGIVMDLADSHGVQVHNLQPGSSRQTTEDGKVIITRITLGAEGDYARLATFLDAVCSVDAFIRPVSLQLDPSRDETRATVEATLTCDVLNFPIDPALGDLLAGPATDERQGGAIISSAAGGSSHGQP